MKRLGFLLAMVAAVGLVRPAGADVLVTATVDKDKDKTVVENIEIDKDIDLHITVDARVTKGAEAESILNQSQRGNIVDQEGAEEFGNNFRNALIQDSINTNIGIVQVNQDAGNMNNQANDVAAAIVIDPELAFANSQGSVEQVIEESSVFSREEFLPDSPPQKQDLIANSINGNIGIVGVNQSVGNMNNQGNQVAIAVAVAAVALSEADLGQSISGASLEETSTLKVDSIQGSINGNIGIAGVNQSAGSMNNQANVVSVSLGGLPF